ncbi:MAG: hypothetical protein KKA65_00855 [Nanoarchaeota archaeon]|nr:hypothetical protein [Nanoarchaeota archaeon]MBU4242250.1 hypothetical protein [Nanoarchaeota archaeon]MBU4352271.1 hypothetical protein [Nanoarchaeota archaeon]MBU4456027.1 hypothetical protein [Nanoarchaeota archaeon]MCG2719537.1 hypothetical protein [Nanoarchaeota archaeon]
MEQTYQESYTGADVVIELTNRLRVLESKNSLLNERLLVVNQNMIEEYKKLIKDIRSIESEIRDVKNDMQNIKKILKHLTDEAANFAKKDEIRLLEKYIKLWNPLNFVTETDVKNIVEREIKKAKHHKTH